MILEVRVENCFAFSDLVVFSLEADMRSKKLASNVVKVDRFNVLKSVGIYGPNNVGKSCLVKAIKVIRDVMLNNDFRLPFNLFSGNSVSSLGITFLYDGEKYSYDFKYDGNSEEFVYEKFCLISKDEYGNEKEIAIFINDRMNNEYFARNEDLKKMLSLVAGNNIMIYLIDPKNFSEVNTVKEIFVNFASKIDVISMTNIPIRKTIDLLKNKQKLQDKVVEFIKNADLDLQEFFYADNSNIISNVHVEGQPDEDILNIAENVMDQIRLTSVYKGIAVPSLLFDSTGTKKIVALSSYIIEALEFGKILIVDELDSGLHFKLTRAIVAMFNNELNQNAQLIFTVHDINLLDCKALMRKEQVWFIDKDDRGVYMYALSDFTAVDGVRDTTNVIERYKKGLLGALPDPTFIDTLLQIHEQQGEASDDE